jgi:hypothetical protein
VAKFDNWRQAGLIEGFATPGKVPQIRLVLNEHRDFIDVSATIFIDLAIATRGLKGTEKPLDLSDAVTLTAEKLGDGFHKRLRSLMRVDLIFVTI